MDQTIRLRSFHFLSKGGWAVVGSKWSRMDQIVRLRFISSLREVGQ